MNRNMIILEFLLFPGLAFTNHCRRAAHLLGGSQGDRAGPNAGWATIPAALL